MYSKKTTGVKQGIPETDDLYPYGITRRGDDYAVENRITSTVFGYHKSYDSAEEQAKKLKAELNERVAASNHAVVS